MKLIIHYRLTLLLFLAPFLVLANNGDVCVDAKTTKERTIKKSFPVNGNATLKVDNSFGNINIITWNESYIDINVSIKVSGNNDEKIAEKLNGINVEFTADSNRVTAITRIEKNKKRWWNWGKKMSLKMEIDYIIKMPITNNVDLKNQFGSITLDKLEGSAKISCNFGKITTKELLSDTNSLDFNHSKGCYFDYINKADIDANHSSFTVASTKGVNIDANHTNSTVENAERINYDCNFGSLKIDNVNYLNGDGQHQTVRIGSVFKNAKIDTRHGSLKISRVASKANMIDIDSQFTSVTIGYDAAFNFNFDLDFQHGSLRDSDGFNFVNKEVDHSSKRYEGFYGSKDSGNLVKISSRHGSVSFKQQ